MFVEFLYELRRRRVPVGMQEALSLAQALARGLHDNSLLGFYHVARALVVHSETHLDAFDEAFLVHFRGARGRSIELHKELLEWLEHAADHSLELADRDRAWLESLDPEDIGAMLEQRLQQQRERHDGGNQWIGTAGASPFGHSGRRAKGIRVAGASGARSAFSIADARAYRPYRADLTLDVRQMQVALRKLRAFAREGAPDELDLQGTIDATARNAGELEVVTRAPRRPNTRVLLLMDVGGSMDPYAHLVSRLFSAASKASHFKELRSYYFHNCIYGRVYATERFEQPVTVRDLLAGCGRHFKLIVVGDAWMAPYELAGAAYGSQDSPTGLQWLMRIADHFDRCAWLNPEPSRVWPGTTIETIAQVFPMFTLTLEGLGEAVTHLTRGGSRAG